MSTAPEKQISVTIYGEQYSIAGEDPERLQSIARMVDQSMKQIGQAVGDIGLSRLAILAALNLASDLLQLQEQTQADSRRWEEGTGELLRMVEAVLPDEAGDRDP